MASAGVSSRLRGKARRGAWKALVAGALLVLSVALSACGSSSSGTSTAAEKGSAGTESSETESSASSAAGGGEASAPSGEVKMAIALNGPKNDESFNQSTYEGAEEAMKEFPNLKLTSVLENRATQEQVTDALDTLAPLNNLVVTGGGEFAPSLEAVAPNFTKTYFLEAAGEPERTLVSNVTGFNTERGESTYVGGVIAAHLTKTNVVGFVGGEEIPPTVEGKAGFDAGVASVNPKIKVLNTLTGDFNNVAEAKAATTAMINENADVIFPYLDSGTAGAYQAGRESGKNPAMFKIVIPKCEEYPNVVGTVINNAKVGTRLLIAAYLHHVIKPGGVLVGLKDPEVENLELCPKYKANKEIANIYKTTVEEINDGTRTVPAPALIPPPKYPAQDSIPTAGEG